MLSCVIHSRRTRFPVTCPHRLYTPPARTTPKSPCILYLNANQCLSQHTIMSLNNSLTARLDELRSRNLSRLHSENTTGQSTPSFRHSGSFMSPPQAPTPIEPPNLQRRFTTDLSKMQPQVPPIGQQLGNGGSSTDVPPSVCRPDLAMSNAALGCCRIQPPGFNTFMC